MRLRLMLSVAGVLAAAYGGVLLLAEDRADVVDAALWLGGGVVLHDLVLAPLLVVFGFAASHWLPARWRTPIAAGGIVLGSITLLAVPVLGRFGARRDNPSLLDRPYVTAWLGLLALVLLGVVGQVVVQHLRARVSSRRGDGSGPGR
jgi:hypothetical protein